MKNEFYDIAFRKKIYNSLEELRQDVDLWLDSDNKQRSHSGKYCYGKTLMQTFLDSKHIALEKSNQSMYYYYLSDNRNLYDTQIS